VYLYGSTAETLDRLMPALTARFPALKIAGAEPSKFRAARPGEPAEIAARIRESGARVVLVGLGCPRQEVFAYAMRPLLSAPLLAVGAAFDYHAGQLRKPPAWMQRRGLEWLWRLGLEPGRLWKRYLLLNPAYLARLAAQKAKLWRAAPPPAATEPLDMFAI
jgi:exopolysaccharide biosynthesis WecB/TagA/CpsF family protein